jgi:Gpi18-like mannosyltransferase
MQVKQFVFPSIILITLIFFLCPIYGHWGDLGTFFHWSEYMAKYGLGNIYYMYADLPPVYYYLLKLNRFIFGEQPFEIFSYQIKYFTVIIEVTGILLVLYSLTNKNNLLLCWSLLAFNFSYFYNSVIWGQIDGIPAVLNFAAIFFAYRKNWPLAISFFVLSMNVKIQQVIFVPLLLIMFINDFRILTRKKVLFTILSGLAIQFIILIPFMHPGKLKQIGQIIITSVGRYPVISLNAGNIWQLIYPGMPLRDTPDSIEFLNITLKTWGLLMMGIAMLLVYLPFIKNLFNTLIRKIQRDLSYDQIMLIATLTPLLFFFFNTQMHERYTHNSWLFLAAWCFNSKNYIPLILFSVAYYLNLNAALFHLDEPNTGRTLICSSVLFGFIIIYLLWQLLAGMKKNIGAKSDILSV